MSTLCVVLCDPLVQVGLQRFEVAVDFLAKRDLVKLLQHRLVEALADAIGLRRFHLGLRMINVVDCREQLGIGKITAIVFDVEKYRRAGI